jgi:hypothetical protein
MDAFFDDVAKAYQKAIRAFYDAGCRYLQMDDTAWSMMCDPREREHSRERGDDPDKLPPIYAEMTNTALAGKPADMTITMHSCRGNFRSTFIAAGGYEFVAEPLLGRTNLDGYFLNMTPSFRWLEPLRFVPKGRRTSCWARHLKERYAGIQRLDQAPHDEATNMSHSISLPVTAMQFRLDGRRQRFENSGAKLPRSWNWPRTSGK